MARGKPPIIPDALLDQLLASRDPQAALGRDGLIDELKRALAGRNGVRTNSKTASARGRSTCDDA